MIDGASAKGYVINTLIYHLFNMDMILHGPDSSALSICVQSHMHPEQIFALFTPK